MALPQKAPPPPSPVPNAAASKPVATTSQGQAVRRLKKGEILFSEGENSRAMYYLKNGMIRIFKKKGDTLIEIDTVHAGSVLGELAFLDGNPRSASGEALIDCELVEISGSAFSQTLNTMPEWLKILLKTVVGRLRTASTRIRQLETASAAVDYSDPGGKRSANYVYLSPTDVLKILAAVLLVASRNGKKNERDEKIELPVRLVQRYANQIMGIPVAKITTMLDVLTQLGLMSSVEESDLTRTFLRDPDYIEALIGYLNEENLCEPGKRHDISPRTFLVMSLIIKHLALFPTDERTGMTKVNLAKIQELECKGGKDAFRIEEFTQLANLGYATNVNIKSGAEAFTYVKAEDFMRAFRMQRFVISIVAVNEQKRKTSTGMK